MSASSINRAANDVQLQSRIIALVNKEVLVDAALADTDFGKKVLGGYAIFTSLYWAVAVETEAAYETALLNQRGSPGFDPDIITDAAIRATIVARWPANTPLTTP